MRVSDEMKECVGLLGVRKPTGNGLSYRGTAFFMSMPSEQGPQYGHLYIVTAKHNVERAKPLGPLSLRFNSVDGKCPVIELEGDWLYPDDEAVDIAVMEIDFGGSVFARSIPEIMVPNQETRDGLGIGIGTDLFVVGLFRYHHGRERNVPVVRKGIIAAMPEEPIRDRDTGLYYQAYLAEMLSIGGLSGSPVFVDLLTINYPQMGLAHGHTITLPFPPISRSWHLLGLIRGHWDYADAAEEVEDAAGKEAPNTGIAVITPIDSVMEILRSDELVKRRHQKDVLEMNKETSVSDA